MSTFREKLEQSGAARGRNGRDYRVLCPDDKYPNCPHHHNIERVDGGNRELIVGYRGDIFENTDAAIAWADVDQRFYGPVNLPWTKRNEILTSKENK